MTTSTELKNRETGKKKDFSINHILNHAGVSVQQSVETAKYSAKQVDVLGSSGSVMAHFEWMACSRYCPPRVSRRRSQDVRNSGPPVKRQLGRLPRIPFTSTQIAILEDQYQKTRYLSSEQVNHLSDLLQLADIRIKIWFQNRRARERREQIQPSQVKHENYTEISRTFPICETQSIKSNSEQSIY